MGDILNGYNARLVSIQVEQAAPPLFTVVMIRNTGAYAKKWWWFFGQSEADIATHAKELNARVTKLDVYEAGGNTRFAAIFESNDGSDAKKWWWYYGQTTEQIAALIQRDHARLLDLRQYVSQGAVRYAVVMEENTGADATSWWWFTNIGAAELKEQVARNGAYVTSLQIADPARQTYDVIMEKLPTQHGQGEWVDAPRLPVPSAAFKPEDWLIDLKSYVVAGQQRFTMAGLSMAHRQ